MDSGTTVSNLVAQVPGEALFSDDIQRIHARSSTAKRTGDDGGGKEPRLEVAWEQAFSNSNHGACVYSIMLLYGMVWYGVVG
jgi:hypothetical protein